MSIGILSFRLEESTFFFVDSKLVEDRDDLFFEDSLEVVLLFITVFDFHYDANLFDNLLESVGVEDGDLGLEIALHCDVEVEQGANTHLLLLQILILPHPHHLLRKVWYTLMQIHLPKLTHPLPLIDFRFECQLPFIRFELNLLSRPISFVTFTATTLLIKLGEYLIPGT